MDAGALPATRTCQRSSRSVEYRQSLDARTRDGTCLFNRASETRRSTYFTEPHHGRRWVVTGHGGNSKRTSSWRSSRKSRRPAAIQRQAERDHPCFKQARRNARPAESHLDALGRRNNSHRLPKKRQAIRLRRVYEVANRGNDLF